jgi:transcriptional regulator with XRE-family HTH domain
VNVSDEIRLSIAARIREARKMAGLSQGQVAKLLKLHRPAVSELEAGNRRVSAEELAQMASLFDVSIAWLVGEAPEAVESDDPRVQLAARELKRLKPENLDRLMRVLAAIRSET